MDVRERTLLSFMMVSSHLEPGRNNILAFDLQTPFKYDKTKNLMVVFDKDGAVASDLMFCAVYKVFNATSSNIYRMLEYSEPAPFDMSKSHAYNSAPVLYLGFDVANNIGNAHVAGRNILLRCQQPYDDLRKEYQGSKLLLSRW